MITGCGISSAKKLEKITANAPDAAAYLLEELKSKRIIFINEDHTIMNEELFLAEYIQEFYDAGVRYFFSEGNVTRENFVPMYPWMSGGRRVEERNLREALVSLEQSTAASDPFKVVLAEAGVDYEKYDPSNDVAWLNYRDENAAKNIIEALNNAPPDAKAICYFGSAHGIKTVTKETLNNERRVDRAPLGYLLSKQYGSAFTSWCFITDYDIKPAFVDAWTQSISGSKYIPAKDMIQSNLVYKDSYKQRANYFDAFIAEHKASFGIVANYVPTDGMLRYWVQFLKELKDPEGRAVPKIELDAATAVMLYYVKLYYGDHFNYAFWKKPGDEPGSSLLQALEELESYGFNENVKPSEMIRFHHSPEDMRLYCSDMFYSNLNDVYYYGYDIADTNIQSLMNARKLFPEDIWSLYWIAFVQTETSVYAEGLANFQELFAHDLSLCMSTLPLAYKKAATCAAALGNTRLSEEYTALSEGLYNEQGIDPSKGPFSIETGYHLK